MWAYLIEMAMKSNADRLMILRVLLLSASITNGAAKHSFR